MSFKKFIFLLYSYTISISLHAVECKPFDVLSSYSEPHTPYYEKTYAHQSHTPPHITSFEKENTREVLNEVVTRLKEYQRNNRPPLRILCRKPISPSLREKQE